MFDYFDYFLPKSVTFSDDYPLFETKNGYEFEMHAFAVNEREGYAIVEGPDSGRITEMEDLIREEFESTIEGWLVLLERQKAVGKTIFANPGFAHLQDVTHYDNHTPVWIIKIKPDAKSRLLARSHERDLR